MPPPPPSLRGPARPVLDVVVPVHDEERDLEPCLRRLHAHLTELPWPLRASTTVDGGTLYDLSSAAGGV